MSLGWPFEDEPTKKWEVYKYYTSRTSEAKVKYVVVVAIEPEILAFYINTKIPEFISKRAELMPCFVVVRQAYNPYLKYDSYLDCSSIVDEITEVELIGNCVGGLCEIAIEEVKHAVGNCKKVKQYHRNSILK